MEINKYLSQLFKVLQFAAEKHKSQHRKDGKIPYINHPIQVANILVENDENDIDLLSAALLHDTLEDTATHESEIQELFGSRVLEIVKECSDDKNLSKMERKQLQISESPKKSREARALKIADKICNIRDIAKCPPKNWDVSKREEYLDWAEKVVTGIYGTNEKLENLFNDSLQKSRSLLLELDPKG